MKTQPKKKTVIRIIAAILIIVLAGVASYHGSKAFFTYKFKKDKEEAEEREEKELASSIKENYVSLIRVGKCTALRILNTENSKLSFILMRPDSDLFTYDEEGNGEEIKKLVNNVENAYSISIESYEDFDQKAFIDLINESDSFECDLPYAVSFKDNNQMTVDLDAGQHILNGIQSWGVVAGYGEYESEEAYMENVEAFLEGYTGVLFDDATKDSMTEYSKILLSSCESNKTADDVKNYMSYYAKVKADEIFITELDGEETENGFEIDIDEAKSVINDILDGKSVSNKKTTTEEKTEEEKEEISSKGKIIYIRNAAYINGLAGEWNSELENAGYTIGSVDNYDETYEHTIIRVSEEGMGEDLKETYFKEATIEVGDVEDGADICIYLGKDADTLD
ncbi:MAG: LCP family protein [Lachnospiraceae bacterium]|nr:LCP family protein [Lachnospiraceae bacterium]